MVYIDVKINLKATGAGTEVRKVVQVVVNPVGFTSPVYDFQKILE